MHATLNESVNVLRGSQVTLARTWFAALSAYMAELELIAVEVDAAIVVSLDEVAFNNASHLKNDPCDSVCVEYKSK